jgi:hypothetical protein
MRGKSNRRKDRVSLCRDVREGVMDGGGDRDGGSYVIHDGDAVQMEWQEHMFMHAELPIAHRRNQCRGILYLLRQFAIVGIGLAQIKNIKGVFAGF